jgi:methylmalonic aciduria homocystinuria type C protein
MGASGGEPEVTGALIARLAPLGLDLVHPFALGWVNETLAPEQRLAGGSDRLGLLVGNTRALWAPLVSACRRDPSLGESADPVERYCETVLRAAVDRLGVAAAIRWAHDPAPRLPIQRLAQLSGLAPLSPVGLNVHPTYGPWIALRALMVVDAAGPAGDPPAVASPCAGCVHSCVPLFERARAAQVGRQGIGETWRLWLALRDACPVGREWRYPEAMIRYHYARDRSALT